MSISRRSIRTRTRYCRKPSAAPLPLPLPAARSASFRSDPTLGLQDALECFRDKTDGDQAEQETELSNQIVEFQSKVDGSSKNPMVLVQQLQAQAGAFAAIWRENVQASTDSYRTLLKDLVDENICEKEGPALSFPWPTHQPHHPLRPIPTP
jgi:hypothetical protein